MDEQKSFTPYEPPQSPNGAAARIVITELIKIVCVVAIVVWLVQYFLFRPFTVKGASMEPNYETRQYLIIDKVTYRFNEPQRGDVVVLRHNEDIREYFLKRVVALPGERIRIQHGKVTIYDGAHPDGVILDEHAYLDPAISTNGELIMTMGSDEYFVLGDNRPVSQDSRIIGPVKRADIIGRVWLRGWPLDKFGRIDQPLYNF